MRKSNNKIFHLWLLLLLFFLGNLDVQIISPILPNITEDFSIGILLAGFSVTAYSASGAVWALIMGPLSDRYGRIMFIRIAALCFIVASLLAFFAHRFNFYILARTVAGFSGGTFTACIIAQIADLFSFERRGRVMGLVGAVYSLAAVVGVPVGAIAAARYGWRALYLVFALAAFLLWVLLSRVHPPRQAATAEMPGAAPAARSQKSTAGQAIAGQVRDYLAFWLHRHTRDGLLLAVLIAATSTCLMLYLGAWLAQIFNLQGTALALVFLAAGLATVAGSLAGGFLADRLGKRRSVSLSSIAISLVLSLTYYVQTLPGVYLFAIAGGLLIALRQGPYEALITELVPSARRGAYIAMRSTSAKLAIAVAAAIAGLLFEISGYVAVTALAALLSLCTALLAHFRFRHLAEPAAAAVTTSHSTPAAGTEV